MHTQDANRLATCTENLQHDVEIKYQKLITTKPNITRQNSYFHNK